MKLLINGQPVELPGEPTLAELLRQRGQAAGVAAAVNGEFVPRAEHAARRLRDGDEVEIVAPMQGG